MFTISVMELVVCLSEVIDLMSEEIRDHHKRVACGAYQLASACGISGEERRDIVIAAALHDIGGLSLEARKNAALHFEDTNSHAEKGYKLLSGFEPFHNVSKFIRHHHAQWNYGQYTDAKGRPIDPASQIILLADRIAVMLTPGIQALTRSKQATENIVAQSGVVFDPALVEVFTHIAPKDIFWLNILSQSFYDSIMDELKTDDIVLSGVYMEEMLNLISTIVDFRSVFTTMHSKGVAAVAERLATLVGLSPKDCYTIRVAALLHDVGKLAIPTEILDKPGPLTAYERDIIRTHSYYTDRVLASLSGFEKVQKWAALHHENLNGMGYPYGCQDDELSMGAKIMKVADIFVALVEDRPYRKGMDTTQIQAILTSMVERSEVDGTIAGVLFGNMPLMQELCDKAETMAAQEYKEFSDMSAKPESSRL